MVPVSDVDPRFAKIIGDFAARHVTIACAESLTGGLVAAALTAVPGASAVFRGGIVCYATDLKATLVGVSSSLLATAGAVHPRVAEQLAQGVRDRCQATVGIGLTGVAGPDPQDGCEPGTVFVAVADEHQVVCQKLPAMAEVSRSAIRGAAVMLAASLLERWVAGTLGQ